MRNSNPKAVDFLGYQIECFQDDDGSMYVPLKRLCEILGIDYKWQMKKVKREEIFDEKVLPVVGKHGRHRKMFCLPLRTIHFWIFRVDPNTVRPEIIDRLIDYRGESRIAIRDMEQDGITFNPREPAEQIERHVREVMDRIIEMRAPAPLNPRLKRHLLLQTELDVFSRISNEGPLFREKASECILAAIDRYIEWLADFGYCKSHDPLTYR